MVRVRTSAALAETARGTTALTATILGRYTFYGDSAFDTSATSIQAAIAPDKTPLLPGQTSTFANYTSYVDGVNGIAIDASNWPATPVASDFVIKAGNTSSPSTWTTITQTATFGIERGGGTGGSDRIVIRLPDNTYRNEWVQVTVNPTADTGLSSPDVFYFGNAVGDDGHGLTNAIVDSSNETSARLGAHGFTGTVSTADLYDFNRDGRVDVTDQLIARQSVDTAATALQYFTAPTLADPGTTGSFSAVFNVKNYGATGNGTTDDTAAIQNAVNALAAYGQGLLYFPAGTYSISSMIYLHGLNNFEIRGIGATLKASSSLETVDIGGDLLRLDDCSNFTINGLTLDADSSQRTQNANPCSLRLSEAVNFHITDCTFNNTIGDAIYMCAMSASNDATATHDGLVEGCSINSAWRNGISIIHASRVLIESNLIQNVSGTAPESGIDVEANYTDSNGANHDISINGNRFQNIAIYGVCLPTTENSFNITVDSNQFSNMPTAVFNQAQDTVIDNNICSNYSNTTPTPTSYGMIYSSLYANGKHVEITGNTISAMSNVGAITIDSQWIGSALISDNRISNLTGSGFNAISLADDNAVVTANIITNCSDVPIAINGAGADVENNILSGGTGDGIIVAGTNMIIRGNTVSNFAIGLDLRDNLTTGVTAAASIVSGNTVTGCPTGIMSSLIHSQITGNTFSNATKPASGAGSDAMAEILLLDAGNATTVISGNTLTNINGVTGIDIVGNWTGQATITNNQLTTIGGGAIATGAPSIVSGNTITNAVGGIAIFANNCDVENNVISGGFGTGVYAAADGMTFKANSITNEAIGMQLVSPTGSSSASPFTVISGNSFTGCYTAILSSLINSQIIGNTFSNATKPASGAGSDAMAEILLLDAGNATTVISGNTLTNINGVTGIDIVGNWTGQATITNNQLTAIQGGAIGTGAPSVISGNTIINAGGGIAIFANNCDVENNVISGGFGTAIYVVGNGTTLKANTMADEVTGIQVQDPAGGPIVGLYTVISGNTFTDCYTAVSDAETYSTVSSNLFQNVTKPTSGAGSDTLGELFLGSVTNGTATISGNTFNNINSIQPILVHGTWSGTVTITGNQISNIQGPVTAIGVSTTAIISSNTLLNVYGAIANSGNGSYIENNTITNGTAGIYSDGTGDFILNNILTDLGDPLVGDCIFTLNGNGTTISGNTLRKTIPNPAWVPIVYFATDILGVNYAYGIGGFNGAFVPGQGAVPSDPTMPPAQEPIVVAPIATDPVTTAPVATTPSNPTPIVTTPVKKTPAAKKTVKKAPVVHKPVAKPAVSKHRTAAVKVLARTAE